MKINVFYNANGVGLQQDFNILREELLARGHEVEGLVFHDPLSWPKDPGADLNVFLEVIIPRALSFAPDNWAVPNPEWWPVTLWNTHLCRFSKILCKTRYTQEIFDGLLAKLQLPVETVYTSWRSRDLLDSTIERKPAFLHVGGNGAFRGTLAVYQTWRHCGINLPLTIVAANPPVGPLAENVTWLTRVSDEELRQLMNSHLFHLCPSEIEGWGHALHESLGVGAVVVTTDAPPMNEIAGPAALIEPTSIWYEEGLVRFRKVDARGVLPAVSQVRSLGEDKITIFRKLARARFLAESKNFSQALDGLFGIRTEEKA